MAAIDKIYVNNWEQYQEFKNWMLQQPPLLDKYGRSVPLIKYFYDYWEEKDFPQDRPIFNAPYYVDAYVIRNCPFDFIQKELMINYGHWSQERIKEFYNNVKNWDSSQEECPYWAKLEDFITLEDGSMTIKGLEESDYSKIKRGILYTSPIADIEYTVGKHFKCVKHPSHKYNTPCGCKRYFIDVILPTEIKGYMWYHKDTNTWDFMQDFVKSSSSNSTYCKTIKALKRHIIKWKLPIGTTVKALGRYSNDTYIFIVKK